MTVNGTLEVGNARDAVTVEATPVAVEFNTSTMSTTVDTKLANTVPLISRNPYLLVELNPAVVLTPATRRTRSSSRNSPATMRLAVNATRRLAIRT